MRSYARDHSDLSAPLCLSQLSLPCSSVSAGRRPSGRRSSLVAAGSRSPDHLHRTATSSGERSTLTIWYQRPFRWLGTSPPPPPSLRPRPTRRRQPQPLHPQQPAPVLRSIPLWSRPIPRRRMSIRPPQLRFRPRPSTRLLRRSTGSSDRWASSPPASPMWSTTPAPPRHHQGNRRL